MFAAALPVRLRVALPNPSERNLNDVRAALGLPVGIALAALATRGLHGYGLVLSVPIPSLVTFVVLALVVGVLAAVLPARRAGRLNVLAALSYE
ncbi:MAG: FtsX-like permease family protein [Gaiellaceae bacterium]